MRHSKIVFGFLSVFILSCSGSNDYPGVDYKYFEKNFKYGDCGKGLTGCVQIKLKSINITEAPAAAKDSLQKKINDFILSPVTGEEVYNSVESLRDSMIASFEQIKKEFPDMPAGYSLERTVHVTTDTLGIFTAALYNFYFLGGAHPNYFTSFINVDVANGNEIKLAGILNKGFESELNKIGENEFRVKRGLKPNDDLTEAGYWFDKGKFKLNANFMITEKGLKFFFNSYEIGPYSFGTTEILIKYSDIRNIIKSKSIIERFVN